LPHPPQWAVLVSVSTQPPPHGVCPAPQLLVHPVAPQTSPGAQTVAQLPQWAGSEAVSTQTSPQRTRVPSHTKSHVPALHVGTANAGAVQGTPQALQLPGSVWRSRQTLPQSVSPGLHRTPHVEPAQNPTPPVGAGQGALQYPQ
jgi:hypothetical protein